MTSRDFVYWLQGFFEIGEAVIITQDQTEMIKRHLELVFKHEPNPMGFCYWLKGFLYRDDRSIITENETNMIKEQLNSVFKHEIDPTMGDESHQQELNHIHSPGFGGKPNELIRC